MIRSIVILSVLLAIVGCGPAVFREEVFFTENGVIHIEEKASVWLYVSSTVKSKDVFPIYYSSTKSGPYSVYFRATSKIDGYESIYLSSIVVRVSDTTEYVVLDEKLVREFNPLPDRNFSDVSIQIPLGELLQFEEGKEVEVCIKYGYESENNVEHCSTFIGKKSSETMSNFDVYMSV